MVVVKLKEDPLTGELMPEDTDWMGLDYEQNINETLLGEVDNEYFV